MHGQLGAIPNAKRITEVDTWAEAEVAERATSRPFGTLVPGGMNLTAGGGGTVAAQKATQR